MQHYRFYYAQNLRSFFLGVLAALTLTVLLQQSAFAANPTYTIEPRGQIEATGGFLTDGSTTPIFVKSGSSWKLSGSYPSDLNIDGYVNTSKPSVLFKYVGANTYVTHVNYTYNEILVKPPAASAQDRCYVAIKQTSSTSAEFVGVDYADNPSSECTDLVKDQTGLSTLNFSTATLAGETLLGVTIPTCTQSPGTSAYSSCVSQRKTALSQLGGAIGNLCSGSQQTNCNYYSDLKKCLDKNVTRKVSYCKGVVDAQAILDGDLSAITANTTDAEIQQICKKLSNKSQRTKCINTATKQRDKLQAEQDQEPTTTCAIDGIGWVVCPLMNFMGTLNDLAWGFINNFLEVQPSLYSSKPVSQAWSAFRDIANILFVIAFLVIVYSQLTGGGITNYGIKKILPKLFLTAVLVNLSFVITALVMDVSNILGASVKSMFEIIDVGSGSGTGATGTNTWATVIGPILAGGITIGLLAAFVIGPAALLAFALVMLILIARQALVVLLVVIAPIAFVAYLLPNTEQWFKKYWKMLFGVAGVYVIVGFIFGASTMASTILFNVAGDDNQTLAIVALGTLAIPLFAVPVALKGALSAAGSIGSKLASMQDKAQSAAAGRAKSKAGDYGKDLGNRWNIAAANGKFGRAPGALSRRRMRRDFLRSSRDAESKRAESVYTTDLLSGDDPKSLKYQQAAGGGIAADSGAAVRASARATQQLHKQFDEDVAAHKTTMTGLTHEQLLAIMNDSSQTSERRAAAGGTIMSRDFRKGHLEALEAAGKLAQSGDTNISDIQKQMAHDMKEKPFALGDQAAGSLLEGKYDGDLTEELKDRVEHKLSPAALAKMNPDEMKKIFALSQISEDEGGLTASQQINLAEVIEAARADTQYKGLIKPEAKEMHDKILATAASARQAKAKADQDAAAATYGPNI